jgi:hypothetical protein
MNGVNAEKASGLLFTMAHDCSRLEKFEAKRVATQLAIGAAEEGV